MDGFKKVHLRLPAVIEVVEGASTSKHERRFEVKPKLICYSL
jgi:hypothetical protein